MSQARFFIIITHFGKKIRLLVTRSPGCYCWKFEVQARNGCFTANNDYDPKRSSKGDRGTCRLVSQPLKDKVLQDKILLELERVGFDDLLGGYSRA